MGNTSYTAHISNKKSAITSKSKLLGVAKHNLRKYKSDDYSKDNIIVLRGTHDLFQDVKNVYHQEFDDVVKEYNEKQKRADRKIEDYFEHVAGLEQPTCAYSRSSGMGRSKTRIKKEGFKTKCFHATDIISYITR